VKPAALIVVLALLSAHACLSMPLRPDLLQKLQEENRLEEARETLREDSQLASEVGARLGRDKATTGTAAVLVLLVDFSDQPADTILHSHRWFETMLFDSANQWSMRNFYLANSYGQLEMSGSIQGWYRVAEPMAYYANDRRGMGYYPQNSQKMVEDAIAAADPFVDFSRFDNDGPDGIPSSGDDDGLVDFLLVVHAGQGYEWTMNPKDIHSHAGTIRDRVVDGVTVREYATEPEEGRVGTFAHEIGHLLGLPDLYDVSLNSFGLGMWSLMSYGSWGGGDGSRPVGLDVWSKAQLGFLTPATVTSNQAGIELACVEDGPYALRLWSEGEVGSQYFLVENRRGKSYDSYLAGIGEGLLVYHVDERYRDNSSETNHLVRLEQADGRFDLDKQRLFGFGSDAGDPFPGTSANGTFGWWTTPANYSNEGLPTEVTLRNISSAGDVMTLDVGVATPVILFEGSLVDDASGDGDGEPDPGEEITLRVRLRNHGIACSSVSASLSTADPFVTVLAATVSPGEIQGHAVSQYLDFRIRIAEGTPQPHNIDFAIDVSGVSDAGLYNSSDKFVVAVPLQRVAGWPRHTPDVIFSPPAVADLDGDGIKEIILGCYDGMAYAWKADGTAVPGWPVALGARTTSKPAVCDIDIDGRPDVVLASQNGKVHALRADGTPLPGWPRSTGGSIISSVALGDIDDDGVVEVVCGSKDGKVYAWNEDGVPVPGWPVDVGGYEIWMSPAIADCDGDRLPEVVIGGFGGKLYVLDGDGSVLDGWPVLFGWGCGSGSPAIADFDGDGVFEIAVSGLFSNSIYLVSGDGKVVPGWPRWAYNCSALSSPIPADIDGDGLPEIAVSTSCGTLVAWNADGSKCEVIEAATQQLIEYCEPLFADLDGTGEQECVLCTAASTSRVYAFGREGPMVGFPIQVAGSVWGTPTLSDIENDGYAEMVVATTAGDVHVWRFVGAKAAGKLEWSQSRGDLWNTGLYGYKPQDNIPMADLAVATTGISFVPASPRQGESMIVAVRVENIGHDAAEDFGVSVSYDDSGESRLIGSVTVSRLAAKSDTTLQFGWVVPGGSPTRLVVADIDREDAVLERSELNNLARQRVYLSVADLGIEITGVEPFPPLIGDTVTVHAHLKNTGADVAAGFVVAFYDSAAGGSECFASSTVDSLAPGREMEIEARYPVGEFDGDFKSLWCVADDAGDVLEYYLSNNRALFRLISGIAGEMIVPSLVVPPRTFRFSRTGLVMEPTVCGCVLLTGAAEPFEEFFESEGSDPDISRNTMVFCSGGDIAGFDLKEGVPFLVSATENEETKPVVWGENIAWVSEGAESTSLVLKRGAMMPETVRTVAGSDIAAPDISSDMLVWEERSTAGSDIWAYDLEAGLVLPVSTGAGDQVSPRVWGRVVVWEDHSRDDGDIRGLDLTLGGEISIAEAAGSQRHPDIWGDLVVWQDQRAGNWDVYAYSLASGSEYPISRQTGEQIAPCIVDSTIMWIDRRGSVDRIMGLKIGGTRAVADVQRFEALSQDALIRVSLAICEKEDAVSYRIYRYSDYKWDPSEQKPSVREYFSLDGDSLHVFEDSLLTERRSYYYKLGVVDGYGEERIHGPVQGQAYRRSPRQFVLGNPFPNPFFHQVDVSFGLPRMVERADTASWPDPGSETSTVEAKIYSVTGRLVRTLNATTLAPGYYRLTWDGHNDRGVRVGPGTYYLTVAAQKSFASRKIILLR
jgi:immune inhibitor A